MYKTRPSARRRSRQGSMFVEAGLILGAVLFTLIGILDLGQVLVFHQGLAERVRTGARWAAVNPYDPTQIKNVVVYNNPVPPAGAKPLLPYLSTDLVTTSFLDPDSPEARITVVVSNYPFRFFTPLIAGAFKAKPIAACLPIEEL